MLHLKQKLFLFGLCLVVLPAPAEEMDPRVKAVQDYITKKDDYPELFKDKPYRIKVSDIKIGDLDGDGIDEVVVAVNPHYQQSPTILIFQVNKKLKVTRVIEGLAPGPLIPVSGDQIDSHTLGLGVDFSVSGKNGKPINREFIDITMKQFKGVVAYKSFIHADHRSGYGMYIDMKHIESVPKKDNCEAFEFSTVEEIMIARRDGDDTNWLVAKIGDALYAYKIRKITKEGFLDKTMKIFPIKNKKK